MMIASRMVVTGILFFLVVVVGGICLQIFLSRRRSRWPGLILPVLSFLVSLLYLFNLADSGSVVQNILMALVTLLFGAKRLSVTPTRISRSATKLMSSSPQWPDTSSKVPWFSVKSTSAPSGARYSPSSQTPSPSTS